MSSRIIFVLLLPILSYIFLPGICFANSSSSTEQQHPDADGTDGEQLVDGEYSEEVAQEMLHLSGCAYNLASLGECASRIGWRIHDQFEHVCDSRSQRCGFLLAYSHRLRQMALVFRGTFTMTQLLTQMGQSNYGAMVPFRWKGVGHVGKANAYFTNALFKEWPQKKRRRHSARGRKGRVVVMRQSFWARVLESFRTMKTEERQHYQVIFAGHSLGAALAALAALKWALEAETKGTRKKVSLDAIDLKGRHVKVHIEESRAWLYTFGQPRVGTPMLARQIDALIPNRFRVVNGNDVIAHLPPCNLDNWLCDPQRTDSYYHHGIEIWYQNREWGEFVVCPVAEDAGCSNAVLDKRKIGQKWSQLRNTLKGTLARLEGSEKGTWPRALGEEMGKWMAKNLGRVGLADIVRGLVAIPSRLAALRNGYDRWVGDHVFYFGHHKVSQTHLHLDD